MLNKNSKVFPYFVCVWLSQVIWLEECFSLSTHKVVYLESGMDPVMELCLNWSRDI